jgi:hypothetical protein
MTRQTTVTIRATSSSVSRMTATIALIELVGYVALLLWGMHMVQSGVVRAFGSNCVLSSAGLCITGSRRLEPGWR